MMKNAPKTWLESNLTSLNGIQNSNILTKEEILTEILMMGLRLTEGIKLLKLEQLVGKNWYDLLDQKGVKMFTGLCYLEIDSYTIKLSEKGLLLHNYIVPRLIL
jgi:oxygen-independent coproporphyrinogen-3 oxidase